MAIFHSYVSLPDPEDPCMEYLPTLTPKVIKNNPNVGKYSIHGSLGRGMERVYLKTG